MSSEVTSPNGSRRDITRDWLASIMLRRDGTYLPRFAAYYRKMAALPRPWRRQLRRKLAVTVSGAALLLALAGPIAPPARAETAAGIQVVNGEVAITANNKCSLMEAIWNARSANPGNMKADCTAGNASGLDTVVLPAGGEFVLTAAHNEVYGPTGLPVITSAVVIEGNGATIRRAGGIWDDPRFRILAVDTAGALTLRDTLISNGSTTDFFDNANGGGILSYGTLILERATISDNRVYGYSSHGGGVHTAGPTTIIDSVISNNGAYSGGCGGTGGGIMIAAESQATISGSDIVDNKTEGYCGGEGGGIHVRGQATIIDSTIAGNVSGGGEGSFGGGGMIVSGQALITGSTISDNLAAPYYEGFSYDVHPGMGGGLTNTGTTEIVNSTISGNAANLGGGIANLLDGDLTITSSTLSGNDAFESFYTENGYIYDEEGGTGGGIFSDRHYGIDNCSTTTLKGVIVSGNTSEVSARQIHFGPSTEGYCTATITVNAFNVFGQNGSAGLSGLNKGTTDIVPSVALAAILSPLADNGGPTQTHALLAGSPALDLAPSASCAAAPVSGVDQRGEARNENGAGGATANECDAGSYEMRAGSGGGMGFLVSPTSSGTVGGVAFAPADILKYDPATGWSMYFDGSDVGVTKNLSAFEVLDNGHILMSFSANQPTPAGTFAPQDVARFVPTAVGSLTDGTFQWELDGSANWLTTSGEKIDALGETANGRVAISTAGAAAVKLPNGTALKAQDEDALGFNTSTGAWSAFFDGTPIPGLKGEDVNAMWVDPATGDVYVSIVGAFNLGGVGGNGRDIVKLTPSGAPGGYTPSLWWDGSAAGFPTNIDGLEMLP